MKIKIYKNKQKIKLSEILSILYVTQEISLLYIILLLYSRYFSNKIDNDNSNKDNEKILSIFRYVNADKL